MSFAFFFPGQGSQSLGMMNGFAEQAIVKATFDEASAVLGQDLWAMINGEDAELIGQTVNTQPIMLAAGVATYRAYLKAGGKTPSVVAGHSLGEYTALVAAGALDFADAVKLVRLRAELMQSAVPQGVGAMAAILGLEDDPFLTGQDSTILDLSGDKVKILRQGAIKREDILARLPEISFEEE